MSPVTCSSLVPAYSVGFGWCRVTSQVCRACSSRVACSSGMCFAMAWAMVRSRRVTPTVGSRGARTRSTWAAAFTDRAWVLLGDPAGPPDRDVQRLGAAPGVREPVDQVEGVGDQGHRGGGGDAEGEAEGFGCERGHRGGAVTAERLVGVQVAVAAPGGGAGVGGGGVQDAPLVGELELVEVGLAAGSFVVAQGGEQRVGSEVVDPGPVAGCAAHGSSQARATDTRRGSEPLVHKGIRGVFWRTATTAVDPEPPCAARRDECRWTEAARHHVTRKSSLDHDAAATCGAWVGSRHGCCATCSTNEPGAPRAAVDQRASRHGLPRNLLDHEGCVSGRRRGRRTSPRGRAGPRGRGSGPRGPRRRALARCGRRSRPRWSCRSYGSGLVGTCPYLRQAGPRTCKMARAPTSAG